MKHKKRKTGCSWYVLHANEVMLSAGKLSEIPTRDHILTLLWLVCSYCVPYFSQSEKKLRRGKCTQTGVWIFNRYSVPAGERSGCYQSCIWLRWLSILKLQTPQTCVSWFPVVEVTGVVAINPVCMFTM